MPKKKESRYAELLRELDFEHWTPPWPEYFPDPEDYQPNPPIFIGGPLCDTYVIDETGRHWKCRKEIDMKPYGFASLVELAKEEYRQSSLN